jgi:Uma2 family endonuclease
MSEHEVRPVEVFYPESDGKPMAETDLHRTLLLDMVASVDRYFRNDPLIYVSGNLLLYYEEGHPEKCVAPDFFVVRGVPKRLRRIYKVWEEKKGPDVVVELTSRSTHLEDLGNKRAIYEDLGVLEYYIFDPEGYRFKPPLRGFRLQGGILGAVPPVRTEGERLVFSSDVLGLELHGCGPNLRWVHSKTGEPIPVPGELYDLAEEAKARADQELSRAERERARAEHAEAELARLQKEVSRLRGESRD